MDELSHRERKKLRTRRALVDAALRLFDERGYAETTVADIAAAADVSTKTFFNYFRGKDDVLFADSADRMAVALGVIASRRLGEGVADLLIRLGQETVSWLVSSDAGMDVRLAPARMRMIMTVPSLQARVLLVSYESQRELAEALRKAYPDALDDVTAAAVVGAFVGAGQATVLLSMQRGDSFDNAWAAVRRGIDVALDGVRATVG